MKNTVEATISQQSGQRQGRERRQKKIAIDPTQDRRSGGDRRKTWPLFNEWCSPLQREK